ncbi:two-component system response regulator [Tenacibaculum sp. KUL113]|uniref:response regulator n=1 Tax=Alteromonas sp. KUL150 TaxID=2480805 RepID=UPI0012E5C9CC|nr:response regulator [Alteromonas sp. KUL150]GFD75949.1 two-component system response regulator [Tenacibaculum sp. KUL113]GFD86131.1 two-component system response regulator [Alteromonas sp. KUL150]
MTEPNVKATTYTVLFVDDEPNILRAIKRALFTMDITLLLADSGAKALELMSQTEVHVVISDMKMPQMSGAELLEQVAINYPETFRVVLTGYADIESTIKAVNQGKIHRYLQKPWDNQELIAVVEEGLERVKLKTENLRLQKLTRLQNKKLKDVNASLEQVVQKRTRQIKAALNKIEKHNIAMEQVLFNVISINPNIDGKFAIEVSELASKIARIARFEKDEIKNVRYAGLICELGLLGLETEDFKAPFSKLKYQQQQNYLSQTKQAALILAPAHELNQVSDIIEFQFEHYNGSGLYNKVAKEIPAGARILAIARDYWRHVTGRMSGIEMSPRDAKLEMKKHRNTRYDGEFLDFLLEAEDVTTSKLLSTSLKASQLKSGMILAQNLYNDSHILILPEGHVLSDATIQKLIHFEEERGKAFSIQIEPENLSAPINS